MFKVAINMIRAHHVHNRALEVETVDLDTVMDRLANQQNHRPADAPAFEFLHWMAFLDSRESEVMKLRFIKEWEYREIAAAQAVPIGTVPWRVFNVKMKLAPYLSAYSEALPTAA